MRFRQHIYIWTYDELLSQQVIKGMVLTKNFATRKCIPTLVTA